MHFRYHKINSTLSGSYIGYPDWINKKAIANLINKDDNKYVQCTTTLAINEEEIQKNSGRISKIELFINKNNWKDIKYPSGKDKWIKFEKYNLAITLNVSYAKKGKSISCFRFET